jgi:hypothetical protein
MASPPCNPSLVSIKCSPLKVVGGIKCSQSIKKQCSTAQTHKTGKCWWSAMTGCVTKSLKAPKCTKLKNTAKQHTSGGPVPGQA